MSNKHALSKQVLHKTNQIICSIKSFIGKKGKKQVIKIKSLQLHFGPRKENKSEVWNIVNKINTALQEQVPFIISPV